MCFTKFNYLLTEITMTKCRIVPSSVQVLSHTKYSWWLSGSSFTRGEMFASRLSASERRRRLGNRHISKDSAANLRVPSPGVHARLLCSVPQGATEAHVDASSQSTQKEVYLKWIYLNINMCTKLQATIAPFFFFFSK